VSSVMESVLGSLLSNTTRMNVVNELVAKFQKVDMHHLKTRTAHNPDLRPFARTTTWLGLAS
jgi:hypothetical protein